IYLSLCKKFDFILVRVDNRWMDTVPSNTPHPKNGELIQPYLVAYFKSNGLDIDKNKEWLKEYIKNATTLKDSDINESMMHLYCSGNNPPREGNVSLIVKSWPYRPIQKDAENCYMRSHNFGYRIRLGNVVYEWFRNQKYKSFVFNKTNYNTIINEEKSKYNGNENRVKGGNALNISNVTTQISSKQLKVEYEEIYNGMAMAQTLVAKAKIHAIQNEAFYGRDESVNQIYFELYLNLYERAQFRQFYQYKFPKLIQSIKEIDQKWVRFYFDNHVFDFQLIPSFSSLF
ncbi:hypothetical protein RFI_05133, partial [Reticulomyxa filosa]